jgi:hypothetical protein
MRSVFLVVAFEDLFGGLPGYQAADHPGGAIEVRDRVGRRRAAIDDGYEQRGERDGE